MGPLQGWGWDCCVIHVYLFTYINLDIFFSHAAYRQDMLIEGVLSWVLTILAGLGLGLPCNAMPRLSEGRLVSLASLIQSLFSTG